jgi:septal ring factor EnvC (AmiA/AmiB activator)
VIFVALFGAAFHVAAEDGATRESIIKSRLKLQIGESHKLASMADRLASMGTIKSMNQRELESLQKQIKTDMDKTIKVLEAAKDLREKDKTIDDQSKVLENIHKQAAKSYASVTKLLEARAGKK